MSTPQATQQPSQQPTQPGIPQQADSDLEYDLAHEWRSEPATALAPDRPSVYVATETVDTGGDYGYDLAHDVPGR